MRTAAKYRLPKHFHHTFQEGSWKSEAVQNVRSNSGFVNLPDDSIARKTVHTSNELLNLIVRCIYLSSTLAQCTR